MAKVVKRVKDMRVGGAIKAKPKGRLLMGIRRKNKPGSGDYVLDQDILE